MQWVATTNKFSDTCNMAYGISTIDSGNKRFLFFVCSNNVPTQADGNPLVCQSSVRGSVSWTGAILNLDTNVFNANAGIWGSDSSWPVCVGQNLTMANSPRPSLAYDPQRRSIISAMSVSSPLGQRVIVHEGIIDLEPGQNPPATWIAPNPRNVDGVTRTDVTDQIVPAAAFADDPPLDPGHVGVIWMDNRDAPAGSGQFGNVYGIASDSGTARLNGSVPTAQVGYKSFSGSAPAAFTSNYIGLTKTSWGYIPHYDQTYAFYGAFSQGSSGQTVVFIDP